MLSTDFWEIFFLPVSKREIGWNILKRNCKKEKSGFFLEFFVVVLYLRLDFLAFLSFINVKQDFSKFKYAMLWIQNVLYFMQRSESINKNMPRP